MTAPVITENELLLRRIRRAKERQKKSPSMANARFVQQNEERLRQWRRENFKIMAGGLTNAGSED